MRTILAGICILFALTATAQRECATTSYFGQRSSADPLLESRVKGIENFIQHQPVAATKPDGEGSILIRIPVVVHVIYKTSEQNIPDAQIISQIEALNRDFRRRNSDSVNTPARFKGLAADIRIEFALATADPQGRATTGILRRQTTVSEWKVDDKIKYKAQGGDDAWDSKSYLNIWVGNLGRILGYSSVLGDAAEKDGLVIHYNTFGTVNVPGPYNLGRTAVHETGHWLGLKHIWGDTYCGDDGVDDTPKQGNFTSGCPTAFRSSCSNGDMGDMYMNYMDYTNDACLNLFTQGQKQRMLTLFNQGGPRNALLSSKGLNEPWNFEAPPVEAPADPETAAKAFHFYPNPVASEIVLNFEQNTSWIGQTVSIINLNGVVLMRVQIVSQVQKINMASLRPGMYFIQGEAGKEKVRAKFVKL